jgi:hypothetical protein
MIQRAAPFGEFALAPKPTLNILVCSLTPLETAALEPGINASGDLRPQANVRTDQCIDLRMIQFPSLLAKSFKRVFRRSHELDPQFLVRRKPTYYSFNDSL